MARGKAVSVDWGGRVFITANADHEAGEVVDFMEMMNQDHIAIWSKDVEAGELGSAFIAGKHVLPKGPEILMYGGSPVYWDEANQQIVGEASGNRYAGLVAKPATAEDETVEVVINA